jgi:uncharacterized protein (TIGR00255 family)
MTGFGDARKQNEQLSVAAEVRSVNNRYFKMSAKCPDAYAHLEGDMEKLVRRSIARGTVTLSLRVDRAGVRNRYYLDRDTLKDYWRQLHDLAEVIHVATPTNFGSLLQLPGVVVDDEQSGNDPATDWPLIVETLTEALAKLQTFRETEGVLMQQDLERSCTTIAEQLERVAEMAPQVVRDYRDRIEERVRELLEGTKGEVTSADLIREVSIFSDRCDINEEITRLRCHLQQFEAFLAEKTSLGRKLEFLSQEMFREINTIGSKANNVGIAHAVVEMKAAVEKMREILQNVE